MRQPCSGSFRFELRSDCGEERSIVPVFRQDFLAVDAFKREVSKPVNHVTFPLGDVLQQWLGIFDSEVLKALESGQVVDLPKRA